MSAAARQVVGKCNCLVCGTPDQEIRVSDKGRAYLMCDECDVQIFARSKRSDTALRALVTTPAPKPAPSPAPKPPKEKSADATRPAADPAKPASRGIWSD